MKIDELFPETRRTDTGPAKYSEPRYQYLQRTARAEFATVRTMLESWFTRYPSHHKTELRARFQANDDRSFDSAFFELYLHELMCSLGFAVEVHPPIPKSESNKAPDFLCTMSDERQFFLEATVVRELTDEQAAAQARANDVYDTLDALDSPDFFIGVHYLGSPDTPPPGRKIREFLKRELEKLDPSAYDDWGDHAFDGLPSWEFEHGGWKLRFIAIPKSPSHRGEDGSRPLGMFMPIEASWRNDGARLRESLVDKAGAYGELGVPYVIAANSQLMFTDRLDIMEALFGQETYVFDRFDASAEPEMLRKPNGLWTCGEGPRYTRVSGVMVAHHVLPWSVGSAMMRFYPNPSAAYPVGEALNVLPHATVADQRYHWVDATSPGELLGVEPLYDDSGRGRAP